MRATLPGLQTMIATVLVVGAAAETAAAPSPTLNSPKPPVGQSDRRAGLGRGTRASTVDVRRRCWGRRQRLLTCPDNSVSRSLRARTRQQRRAAGACSGASNNDENMKYVNVDPSAGHFDSTTGDPDGPERCAHRPRPICTGAPTSRAVSPTTMPRSARRATANPIATRNGRRLSLGSAQEATRRPTQRLLRREVVISGAVFAAGQPRGLRRVGQDGRGIANCSGGLAATRRACAGSKQLVVTVANVQASPTATNRHGDWTLLVAWESSTAAWRNLTLFDGFAFVQVEAGQSKVVAPTRLHRVKTPASGKVDAHATTWTYEGDRAIEQEYLALGSLGTECQNLHHMHDGKNPIDNFFNSTISADGATVSGHVPRVRKPARLRPRHHRGTRGDDPQQHNQSSGYLIGTSPSDSLRLFFGGLAFDTLIRAPTSRSQSLPRPRWPSRATRSRTPTTFLTDPKAKTRRSALPDGPRHQRPRLRRPAQRRPDAGTPHPASAPSAAPCACAFGT